MNPVRILTLLKKGSTSCSEILQCFSELTKWQWDQLLNVCENVSALLHIRCTVIEDQVKQGLML